jgi:transposase
VFLGNQSVADYLEQTKQYLPLELKRLVSAQDFSNLSRPTQTGRLPIHPRVFIALIVYGLLNRRTSLRELELLARVDLGAMHLCGGLQPDHSTIGRFIAERQEALSEAFFVEVTARLAKRLKITAGHAAIDGTIVQAVASSYGTMKLEAARAHADDVAREAREEPENKPLQKTAARAAEAVELGDERAVGRKSHGSEPEKTRVSPTEPEAVYQALKQGGVAPSYKPSMLADESGLICGQAVDPSSESAVVATLLDQHREILGQAPESLSADAGYSNETTYTAALERDINLLVPAGREGAKGMKRARSDGRLSKDDFHYDEASNTFVCPARKTLVVIERSTDKGRPYTKYAASKADCGACPLKAKCTAAAVRSIKRYAIDELKEAMAGILAHAQARQVYSRRKVIIETRNSALKERQGLRRFRRRGLAGVRVEFALHCLAHNLGLAARRLVAAAVAALLVLLSLLVDAPRACQRLLKTLLCATRPAHYRFLLRGPAVASL